MELYISKYGAAVNIRNGLIQVRAGDERRQVPVHKVKKIFVNRGCKLTAEVVFTALENGIELIFQRKNGDVAGRLWSNKFGSIATIRKNQLKFAASSESRDWIKEVIAHKIDGQIALLLAIDKGERPETTRINNTISKLEGLKNKLVSDKRESSVDTDGFIRGIEGNASRKYFRCISDVLPEKYRFGRRSRKPARDMFNGMLNYTYGILYARVESALINAGIDPAIGIFHADQYNRPAMVYDVIERFRPWADYVPVKLCMQEVMFPEFFDIPAGYHLNENGKRILIQSFVDYFDETVWFENLERTRTGHLTIYAQKLATFLKKFEHGNGHEQKPGD